MQKKVSKYFNEFHKFMKSGRLHKVMKVSGLTEKEKHQYA